MAFRGARHPATVGFVCFFLANWAFCDESAQSPWRLNDFMPEDSALTLSGHQRTRLEILEGQFRSGWDDQLSILAFRTDLRADLNAEKIAFIGEVMDSRQEGADSGTPLNTSIVNALEVIQAHARFALPCGGSLQLGRYTMDLGTRRFVARNRYRNTVNNFTGLHGTWHASTGEKVQLFYNLPVFRRPTDRDSLLHNRIRIDEENFDTRFWGVYIESPHLVGNAKGDVFLFGLNENDRPDLATANRSLYTGGFRLFELSKPGNWDYEIEAALQMGTSRASRSSSDTRDLDHWAQFLHLESGYTFDHEWSPRFILQFDYASGDKNPYDDENNRFDTLYGARRFDYGPTGTYGSFARSNLISPAYRISFNPASNWNVMVAHRFQWLASETDSWTTAGLRDPQGDSGRYLGHQPEIRIRWEALPGNLRIEGGFAHLFSGRFIRQAPDSEVEGDSSYGYLQSIFTF